MRRFAGCLQLKDLMRQHASCLQPSDPWLALARHDRTKPCVMVTSIYLICLRHAEERSLARVVT